MTFLVPIALLGLPFIGLLVFASQPIHRAILVVLIGGYLFLPQGQIEISGLPEFNRFSSISYSLLIGIVLTGGLRGINTRFSLYDWPMLIWCLAPLATSLSNGLGLYNGISEIEGRVVVWGIPYLVGRIFFSDTRSIRLLAVAVVAMGLVAALMCWFEIRMSPKLHKMIYGYFATKTHMNWRLGGYRPILFLRHGIEAGLLMAFCALTALWIWMGGAADRIGRFPMKLVAPFLLVTAVFCRSLGALFILALGLTALLTARLRIQKAVVLVLICLPVAWVSVRSMGAWYPAKQVEKISSLDRERGRSFEARLDEENVHVKRAWERPVFGWGAYNRYRALDEDGRPIVVDSMWVITFGKYGLVGLVSLGLVLLLPAFLLLRRLPGHLWLSPAGAPAAALAMGVVMYAIDCLMNAMLSPIYHVCAGAVIGFAARRDFSLESVQTSIKKVHQIRPV